MEAFNPFAVFRRCAFLWKNFPLLHYLLPVAWGQHGK